MTSAAGGSSNGRTPGSGPGNGGSSPPPPAIYRFPALWTRRFGRVQHGSRAAPSSRGLGHGPLKAETRVRTPLGPPLLKRAGRQTRMLATSYPPSAQPDRLSLARYVRERYWPVLRPGLAASSVAREWPI